MTERENYSFDFASAFADKNKIRAGSLYLVATPIGNLEDISARALKTLYECDFVAAEDTRNTAKLLRFFGISKPIESYYEHNKEKSGENIISKLKAGKSCALVTDAGMPAISDPGEDIVRLCKEENIEVFIVPGACAAVSALALSGLSTRYFAFEGFLPTDTKTRKQRLEKIAAEERTLILYEAPHKLKNTLCDLQKVMGNRKMCICRELTKINEESIKTTVDEAVLHYESAEPKGEYVLVIEGICEEEIKKTAFWQTLSKREHVEYYVGTGMSKNDAIKAAARDRGVAKSEIYNEVMKK
ncbi:MAG: 16S rRNA (cytidine(1402)-2'-O)-methyltransferase [Clostridia bacterium]|nr:16S rRNA (cytidine(1402)-2'-O)-methyltransferase [Clostridia bacterium]